MNPNAGQEARRPFVYDTPLEWRPQHKKNARSVDRAFSIR